MAGLFRVLFYVGGRAGPPKSGIQPRLPQTCTRPPPGLGNCHDGDVSGPISLSVCSSTSVARPGCENLEINRGTLEWATLSCRGRFWPRFTLRVLFYVGGPAWPALCSSSSSSSSSPTPLYSFNCGRLGRKGRDHRVRILTVNDNWLQNGCIMHSINPYGS